LETGSISLAVAHHLLHYLDEPSQAVDEMARVLAPDGQLLVVDYAPHQLEILRTRYQHRRLGLSEKEVVDWCELAGLDRIEVHHIAPTIPPSDTESDHPVTPFAVTVWSARKPSH